MQPRVLQKRMIEERSDGGSSDSESEENVTISTQVRYDMGRVENLVWIFVQFWGFFKADCRVCGFARPRFCLDECFSYTYKQLMALIVVPPPSVVNLSHCEVSWNPRQNELQICKTIWSTIKPLFNSTQISFFDKSTKPIWERTFTDLSFVYFVYILGNFFIALLKAIF